MSAPRFVLFGAGASYGSPGIVPVSPPLGRNLYPALRRAFPATWGAFSNDLVPQFESHFEQGLAALMRLYPGAVQPLRDGAPSPHALMKDMARFFLAFELAPGRQDLYSRFLMSLLRSPNGTATAFATLNYEHLLERAMSGLGLKPKVLRPHGGCQLWPISGGIIRAGQGRAIGAGMHSISARVRAAPSSRIHQRLNELDQARYPCMAMYMPGKNTQVGQRYLRRMQARFRERVAESRTVVLIGVRPWDEDTHLWPSIYSTSARVLYVGSDEDYRILASNRGRTRATLHIGDRFARVLDVLADEM
ncbi:MAG: hypothetical protein HKN37_14080 [Rhodothermales bacterium]|nr:hypothetical protein [Rhodothermales bacterium]